MSIEGSRAKSPLWRRIKRPLCALPYHYFHAISSLFNDQENFFIRISQELLFFFATSKYHDYTLRNSTKAALFIPRIRGTSPKNLHCSPFFFRYRTFFSGSLPRIAYHVNTQIGNRISNLTKTVNAFLSVCFSFPSLYFIHFLSLYCCSPNWCSYPGRFRTQNSPTVYRLLSFTRNEISRIKHACIHTK